MRRIYSACLVWDRNGDLHDIDIYTGSYDWPTRLRAVRRECLRNGIDVREAYVGGNIWTRQDIMAA